MVSKTDIIRFIAVNWGNLASVAGLIVSIIGFWYTVKIAKEAKTAAQRAEDAARKALQGLLKKQIISDLSEVLRIIDDIKKLQLTGSWEILHYRYSELRKLINSIKGTPADLENEQKSTLVKASQQFAFIEDKITKFLTGSITEIHTARYNRLLTIQQNKLDDILVSITRKMGDLQ